MIDKKCPQCGSRYFQIVDYYAVGYIYEVEDGRVIAEGQDDGGEHVRTTCVCRDCGRQWHPKKMNYEIDE